MSIRNIIKIMLVFTLIFSIVSISIPGKLVKAATPVLQIGDQYGYVWGLQHRLQQLGLYEGHQDGLFGPKTRQAVINFQNNYGLSADGIVGSQTWRYLRANTFTVYEVQMLAQLVYGEARGESLKGQVAVAAVVFNRIDSSKFPNTVSEVIFQPRAFTAVSDGQYYLEPNSDAYQAVYSAIRGWDPTYSSLYYFNPRTATSDWVWSQDITTKIGDHLFAK